MALAVSIEDAQKNQFRNAGDTGRGTRGGTLLVPFFGSRDTPDLPDAHLTQRVPGRVSSSHFHLNDQFQVVVDGEGKLGRHDLSPYCIHFARAYTPYGPLVGLTPLKLFVLRRHWDPGGQHLHKALDKLMQVPDRQPWQITRRAVFSHPQLSSAAEDIILQAVPDMNNEEGLAAYTLSMKPNAIADAPDPSRGDGQYLVMVKGSLLHNKKELQALSLVFVYPKEGPFRMHAGATGLQALVLNFPRSQARESATSANTRARTDSKTWQCALCAFAYDERAGLPDEGIAPGTRWEDIPETWTCPDCSASKADFQMIEV